MDVSNAEGEQERKQPEEKKSVRSKPWRLPPRGGQESSSYTGNLCKRFKQTPLLFVVVFLFSILQTNFTFDNLPVWIAGLDEFCI